jgi:ferritin-like metal-binding protein YciE
MPIGSLRDLYLDELGDLYDAETQMLRALPRLVERTRAPELRDTLNKHCDESRLHLERLELIFTHWGERRKSRPCAGLAGIVQEADDRLNEVTTDDARDAAIIGVAQRIEHYEIAAYGCARTYARRLNRPDEARLLQETLDDEGRADRRLSAIAEAHINDDARAEGDLLTPSSIGRLRYVAATTGLAGQSRERLPIRNEEDQNLGTFDGLVVEAGTDKPRYVVVKGGGLFAQRRYLLPIDAVRFDEASRVLRVDLSREIAERYPPFDADEFQAMSDAGLRTYEAHLLDVFPRETGAPRSPSRRPESGLEWFMNGTWITVPPDRAKTLPKEARTFANEFTPVSGDAESAGRERTVACDRDASTHREPQGRPDQSRGTTSSGSPRAPSKSEADADTRKPPTSGDKTRG